MNLPINRIPKIQPGRLTIASGTFAGMAIESAVHHWKQGKIDGIVTAPVSKEAMKLAGYKFPGQTEMVAKLTKQQHFMMMLLSGKFRVALTTIHLPLKDVPGSISKKKVLEKLFMLNDSLQKDFSIRAPRIAVLGLNPHAGEHGTIGKEEQTMILPAIKQAMQHGIHANGPFPADGFFGKQLHTKYDAILAMYHDQGLIPLKMSGFDTGVNVTLGLLIVRTSPDHGTAFDIAGKGIANPRSMIEAIKTAVTIIQNRNTK